MWGTAATNTELRLFQAPFPVGIWEPLVSLWETVAGEYLGVSHLGSYDSPARTLGIRYAEELSKGYLY